MSAGLFGLLDDIAAIAKLAAASVDDIGAAAGRATTKAAGVVIDDTAVTPQYVHGLAAEREIPIVKKIAWGSIRNKLIIILPVALILSQWFHWAIQPILMLGGTYLAFEGAEKVWHKISGHHDHDVPVAEISPEAEKEMISGAVRTDLILSTEIMVIALNEVSDLGFWLRFGALVAVAFAITLVVYGVVALIVKMDDAGLMMAERGRTAFGRRLGLGLVAAMPRLLAVISVIGTAAMLWVGGHILLVGADELGWHWPYEQVHHLEEAVHGVAGIGGVLGWLINTAASALVGLVVGAIVIAVLHVLPFGKKAEHGLDEAIGGDAAQEGHHPRADS